MEIRLQFPWQPHFDISFFLNLPINDVLSRTHSGPFSYSKLYFCPHFLLKSELITGVSSLLFAFRLSGFCQPHLFKDYVFHSFECPILYALWGLLFIPNLGGAASQY